MSTIEIALWILVIVLSLFVIVLACELFRAHKLLVAERNFYESEVSRLKFKIGLIEN